MEQGGKTMRRIHKASVLLSTVLFSAAAVAAQTATDATAQSNPDMDGITPAQVVYAPKADLTASRLDGIPNEAKLVLSLVVDQQGKAEDVKVIDSEDPALNDPLIAAVRKYQFRPASQDNEPVPYPMNLTFVVQQ
jgi:TonB family protein